MGCAAGCDALQDFLSVTDRLRIAEGMVRLGILPLLEDWVLPERRIHALDSMGHNYFCICPAGAGVGALALFGEDPRAPDWMQAVETVFEEFFDYKGQVLQNKPVSFDAAGAYYEGIHYTDYAVSQYLVYRLARLNVMPEPQPARIPVVERVAEFFAHNLYPTSRSAIGVNFGDDWPPNRGPGAMRLLAAQGFSPELVRWYVQRTNQEPDDPLAVAYYDQTAGAARNTLPRSVIYRDIGWAVLRSSWENDATLLAIRSGFTWNHAHADAGSFILYHAGQQLLIDSGVCRYSRPEYSSYYRQSRGHNVVLFNGHGQPVEDVKLRGGKFPGSVHSLLDGAGLKYIYADATGPMAHHLTRNYRHWLWLDGVILIFDDLLAHEPGRFDWLLHYAGVARRDGNDVEVTNGEAKASVKMLFPADPLIREEDGFAQNDPDRKVTYLAFATAAAALEQKFIVAIVPQPADGSPLAPKLELLREPLALGVRVRHGNTITDVYLNLQADGRRMHLNSNNTIAGWETDAYLFAVTRPAASAAATPENVTRYFVSAASYLRKDGQTVLHSLSKLEAVFQPGAQMEVLLEGQKRIAATLFSPGKPAALSVNGKAALFEHRPKERTIRFRHAS
ncbi:MAG: heparinase II/III family protein [Opitutaceae bacterium]